MTELERYLLSGRLAGCPPDQMDNFVRAGVVLQERQLAASAAARLCDGAGGPTAIGYGGARGGGKSHWLLAQMGADDCQRVPGLKCLLLRKVGKANMEHFEDLRRRLFTGLVHEFSAYRGVLTFGNGSRIIAGHFQSEKDIDAYLGLEYDVIGIEEATTLSSRKHTDISTCCRTSKSNWRPRIYSTSNPGGIGHAWYRKLFIQPHLSRRSQAEADLDHQRALINTGLQPGASTSAVSSAVSTASPSTTSSTLPPQPSQHPNGVSSISPGSDRGGVSGPAVPPWVTRPQKPVSLSPSEGERAGVRGVPFVPIRAIRVSQPSTLNHLWDGHSEAIFIPARVTDNAYNNPEYRKVLESLQGWQRRAWLDGDWDLAAGQYFTSFRREVHIIPDFDETRAREWFAALDYGFAHYTVVLLGCTDGDGNLFVVDEHAERLWLPQRHAEAIRAMVGRHQIGGRALEVGDLRRIVAGTDVFSRQSDGTTIAAQYAREGIPLKPANMDRVNGWAEVMQRLGDGGASVRAKLFIHKRCGRLAETLPAMQHDPNRPEDVLKVDADEDGVGGDDAADALRYLVATKARTVTQRKLRGL